MELKGAWVPYRPSPSPPSSSSTILFWGLIVVAFWWMPFCCFQKAGKPRIISGLSHQKRHCCREWKQNLIFILLGCHGNQPFEFAKSTVQAIFHVFTIDIFVLIHSNVRWTIGCLRTRSDCFSDGWYFPTTMFCKCVGPHRIKTKVPRVRKCREMMELAMELQENKEYSTIM